MPTNIYYRFSGVPKALFIEADYVGKYTVRWYRAEILG
jgi:hypothetical protein